ncbi:MAG: pyridoxamine 5'-phosphate oxidase family protein [Candidatus Binatia bacterium]
MMGIPKELALGQEQIEEIFSTQWNLRIATVGPGRRINVTPMWFVWVGGKIYLYARGQKVINLRRNPNCTVLVDRNEKYAELQGIMMLATGVVLEDAVAEQADPHLAEARVQIGKKYHEGQGQPPVAGPGLSTATAAGSTRRWLVIIPEKIVTWDNFKLGANRESRGRQRP